MSSFTKSFKASRAASNNAAACISAESDSDKQPKPSASSSQGRGIKVWLNGQRFISSGHKQLDELLGGGLLVGSMTLLESDLYSDYADTLLAYSIAEALSNSQDAVLVVESRRAADVLLGSLPYNLTLADELQHSDDHPITSPSTESEADGLRIAWQYDKYSTKDTEQKKRSLKDSFCCSYDLARKAQDSILRSPCLHLLLVDDMLDYVTGDMRPAAPTPQAVLEECHRLVLQVLEKIAAEKSEQHIVRVFAPGLLSMSSCFDVFTEADQRAVLRAVLQLKYTIRERAASLVLTALPALLSREAMGLVSALADNHLGIESFAGAADAVPYEFKEFCGLLVVKRVQAIGVLAPFRPQGYKYGLRRDRRKLNIEALHLPPEESRAFVGDHGAAPSDGNKQTALAPGVACTTSSTHSSSKVSIEF